MPSGATAKEDARERSLDGVRGLAILLVVLYHATIFAYARSTADQIFVGIPRIGFTGVDLFFVLSGFLITRILLRERASGSYFRSFYARRILRVFPLYYALLVGLLLIVPAINALAPYNHFWSPRGEEEPIWYWVFLSNFHTGSTGRFHHEFLGITWSLAIEEQFYLVWPLLVRTLSLTTLRRLCWTLIAGAFALRLAYTLDGGHPMAIYTLTQFRMDTLAVGALIAITAKGDGGLAQAARAGRFVLPALACATLALSVQLIAVPTTLGADRRLTLLAHPLMQTVGYSLFAALFGFLVIDLLARPRSWLARRFEAGWLVALGKYSFAIYLLHSPAAWLTTLFVFDPREFDWPFIAEQLVRDASVLALSFAAAWVSWHVLEDPLRRLRRYFPYSAAP